MQRVTITIDDDLVSEIDAFMEMRGYANRSEALRGVTHGQVSFIPVSLETERIGMAATAPPRSIFMRIQRE